MPQGSGQQLDATRKECQFSAGLSYDDMNPAVAWMTVFCGDVTLPDWPYTRRIGRAWPRAAGRLAHWQAAT